jgi:hypothetical protein
MSHSASVDFAIREDYIGLQPVFDEFAALKRRAESEK